MLCKYCNKANPDDAEWCSDCKNMLIVVEIPTKAIICPHCGKRIPNFLLCEECGEMLDKVLSWE